MSIFLLLFFIFLVENEQQVLLGAFLPNEDYVGYLNQSLIRTAVQIAQEYANEYIMRDCSIKVLFEIIGTGDEGETPEMAINATIKFQEESVVGIIGPEYSYSAYDILDYLSVPVLSFASSTMLIKNPFFFRMVSSAGNFCSALVDVLFSMGYTKLNLIVDDEEYSLSQLIDCVNATKLNEMKLENTFILKESSTDIILEEMAQTLDKNVPNILLLGARRTASTSNELLEKLQDYGLLDRGFIWIVNVILGNRIDSQKGKSQNPFGKETEGILFVSEGDFMFQREYNFQKQMMNRTGMTDPSHVYPYRLHHDSVLVFAKAIQSILSEGKTPVNNPNLMIDSLYRHIDFIGASGRITFLKLNNGERSFYNVDIMNSQGYMDYTYVAKWSTSQLFQWKISSDAKNLTLPSGVTGEGLGITLKNDVPDGTQKFVSVPFVGLSPEFSVGYCSGLYHDENLDDDYLVIFGGEGYGVQYDNIFLFDIKTARWSELQPKVTSSQVHPPVSYHSCVIYGSHMYVFGGIQDGTMVDGLWYFDIKNLEWFEISPLHLTKPQPRFGARLEVVIHNQNMGEKEYLVLFGGRGETSLFSDVWLFDLKEGYWRFLEGLSENPDGRYSFSFHKLDESGVLLVWGGRTSMVSISLNNRTKLETNDMWILDVRDSSDYSTANWTKVHQNNPPESRFGQGSVTIGSTMHVLCGYSFEKGNVLSDYYRVDVSGLTSSSHESSSPTVDWEVRTMDPEFKGRVHFDLVSWDGQILVYGGMTRFEDFGVEDFLTDFWLVNTLEDTFSKIHDHFISPSPMVYFESFVFGKWLYTYGGLDDSLKPTSRMYRFDMINFEWYKVNPVGQVPIRRYGACSVSYNGQFWILGGTDANDEVLSDFWCFNPFSGEFREIETMTGMSGFSKHICIPNEEKMILIGGTSGNEESQKQMNIGEYYVFNMVDESWKVENINHPSSSSSSSSNNYEPVGLLNCNAFYNRPKTILYFEGCGTYSNPLPKIYRLHLSNNSWIPPLSVPEEFRSTEHSLVELDENLYIYMGGKSFDPLLVSNMFVEMYLPDDNTVEFRFVDTETVTHPPPGLGSRCHYYKNKVYCVGGLVGQVLNEKYEHYSLGTISANGVVSSLWLFVNDFVCPPNIHSKTLLECAPCSPGSFNENGVCVPCNPGSYSSNFDFKCEECKPGYFSNESSANGQYFCLPCPHDSYNPKPGQSECLKCPNEKYCPVGSTTPYDNSFGKSDQSVLQPDHFERNMKDSVLTYSISFTVGIIIHIMICCCGYCCWVCRCSNIKCLLFWDCFFENKHGSNRNPKGKWYPGMKVVKKTLMGSYCSTIGFMLLTSFTFATVIIWLRGLDDDETRSLVPRIFSQDAKSLYATDIFVNVVFYDYQSECVFPDGYTCKEGINLQPVGIEGKGTTHCLTNQGGLNNPGRTCEVTWECRDCHVSPDYLEESEIKVVVTVSTADSFATKFHYEVKFTTGYQRRKDALSIVKGDVVGENENVFRGLSSPSLVNLLLIESRYRKDRDTGSSRGFGYHLDFLSTIVGQQAGIEKFHEDNGFAFEINFEMAPYSLEIVRSNPANIFTFIVGLLSSFVGILSVTAIIMRLFELFLEKCCCCSVINDYKDWMNFLDDKKKKQAEDKRRKEMKKLGITDEDNVDEFVNSSSMDLTEPLLTPTPVGKTGGITEAIFDDDDDSDELEVEEDGEEKITREEEVEDKKGEEEEEEKKDDDNSFEDMNDLSKEEERESIIFSDVDAPGSRESINISQSKDDEEKEEFQQLFDDEEEEREEDAEDNVL